MGLRQLIDGLTKKKAKSELVEVIADMESANENAVEVLDDLLLYGNLSLHELKIQKTTYDCREMMKSTLRMFRLQVTFTLSRSP